MDTNNDGSYGTFKTVPSLYNVSLTAPWTWHGWQENLGAAVHKSITETMLGPEPSAEDIEAVLDFLQEMRSPPNLHRLPDGSLSEAARRGELVFEAKRPAARAAIMGVSSPTTNCTTSASARPRTSIRPTILRRCAMCRARSASCTTVGPRVSRK